MDVTIENIFASIENDAAPIYERLAEGKLPKSHERVAFAQFLAVMYVRSPLFRREAANIHRWYFETHIAATAAYKGAFKSFLKKLEAEGKPVADPERVRKSLLDLSHSNLMLPKQLVLRALEVAPKIADIFLAMKWSIARAEAHFFITCDSPVCRAVDPETVHRIYGDHGLLNKTAQITLPITPKRLFIMLWDRGGGPELSLSKAWVENENMKRVSCAQKQIYSHLQYRKLAKLAARYSNVPVATGRGFAGSTGFGGVIVPRKWR